MTWEIGGPDIHGDRLMESTIHERYDGPYSQRYDLDSDGGTPRFGVAEPQLLFSPSGLEELLALVEVLNRLTQGRAA